MTDYEKTYQAGRLKELLEKLKRSGYKFTGRTREVVADLLKASPSQIGRMESINKNLSTELKQEFKEEHINITTAYELSKLDDKQQEKALKEYKSGKVLNPEAVKQHREANKSEPRTPIYRMGREIKIKQEDKNNHMSIDEAIEHCLEVVNNASCSKCASQHRQLATWLNELKELKNQNK